MAIANKKSLKTQIVEALESGELRKYQENKLYNLYSQYQKNRTVKAIFHTTSIIMTAFFIMPYLINGLEGALYASDKTIGDYIKILGFFMSLILAGGVEIASIFAMAELIEDEYLLKTASESNYEKRKKDLMVSKMVAYTVTVIQLTTAFGGILNTYKYMAEDSATKTYKAELKKSYNEATAVVNSLKQKKLNIINGKYIPKDYELRIDNSANKKAMEYKTALDIAKRNLEHAKAEYASYIRGLKANKHNLMRGTTEFTPRVRALSIKKFQQLVLPLQNKVDSLALNVSKIQAVKDKMTVNEFLKKLDSEIAKAEATRATIWDKRKAANDNKEVPYYIYLLIAFAAILIYIMQVGQQSKTDRYRDGIVEILDRIDNKLKMLSKNGNRNFNDEIEALKKNVLGVNIEAYMPEEAEETEKETEEEYIEDTTELSENTQRVLEYMQKSYDKYDFMPSIPKTEIDLQLSNHAVKKAREELRKLGYYTQDRQKIIPTKKFFFKEKENTTQGDQGDLGDQGDRVA